MSRYDMHYNILMLMTQWQHFQFPLSVSAQYDAQAVSFVVYTHEVDRMIQEHLRFLLLFFVAAGAALERNNPFFSCWMSIFSLSFLFIVIHDV